MAKAVRIVTGTKQKSNPETVPKPEPPSLPSVVPERVEQHIKYNFEPVLEDQENPASKVGESDLTGRPEHVRGVYRFADSEDKDDLVRSVRSKVTKDAEWSKIEVHDCDHDRESGTGCGSWFVEDCDSLPPEFSGDFKDLSVKTSAEVETRQSSEVVK